MNKTQLLQETQNLFEEIRTHRRWLHVHAETGFDLKETKPYVKKVLEEMGYIVQDCGKAGLVTTIGNPNGKTFLLRADMDALPIQEETGIEYACQSGKMHACGHDMHTAMLLGAARLLKAHEEELAGTVKLMFQPSEETFEGAKDMIEAGVLDNPRPDGALMVHVAAALPLPAGTVIVSAPGISAPAADYFSICVHGKGCHGSAPQNGIDPLTVAAHILLALQELHSRELAASDEAVLTIGAFHGGEAGNVIPDKAVMDGTIRTYDEKLRSYLKQRITEIAENVATAFRATAEVTFGTGCPTLTNDRELSENVTALLKDLLVMEKVYTTTELMGGKPARGGGSEDFAYISQEIPSLMLSLAAGEPEKGYTFPAHHPKVLFDENVLSIGAAVLAYVAMENV